MEQHDWPTDKAHLLVALGKMEAWSATLRQSARETKQMIRDAEDDSLFQPHSHPIGVPMFEMAMRELDGQIEEILAIKRALDERFREGR